MALGLHFLCCHILQGQHIFFFSMPHKKKKMNFCQAVSVNNNLSVESVLPPSPGAPNRQERFGALLNISTNMSL